MISYNLKTLNGIYDSYVKSNSSQRVIMRCNDRTVTLEEMKSKVDLFIRHLIRLEVKPGVRVGYTMPNCPELFYLFIAISKLGGCAVPLFHMIPDMGKADIYKRCNVELVVTTSRQFESLKECSVKANAGYKIATIDTNPDAEYNFALPIEDGIETEGFILDKTDASLPLLIASSSGTTGIPKLVAMTQSNIAAEVYVSIALALPFDINREDGYSSAMAFPLSTAGILVCMGIMFAGVCLIYSPDISPVKYLQMLSQEKADSMSAPPAYFEAILSLPMLDTFDLTTIKRVMTGMDFFSPSLLQRLKAKFTHITSLANGYGLIETTNVFMNCKISSDQELSNPTNVMTLIEGIGNYIDIRDEEGISVPVGSEGELYVKGANVVHGYIGNEAETQKSFKDGWFRTGDIVRNQGNNTITLLGRKKYLIKRGGKSVSPIVVQNHINKLQGVKASAVVGVPHQLYGEMIWAFIVTKEGCDVQLKDIMRHCRNELANYMVPDQVTFIEEIPKNPGVGKVDFEKLKEMAIKELLTIQGGENG